MKNFHCECGNTLYFANSMCLSCSRPVGFIGGLLEITACDIVEPDLWRACIDHKLYRPCTNYSKNQVCNWLVPAEEDHALCESCRLTDTIPDLSKPNNPQLWYRMERAKRHLLYTLSKLGLPVWDNPEDKEPPLRFQFLEDVSEDEYGQELTVKHTIMTGHSNGMITLNLNEAEDASRLQMREKMNERYRTLIGHLRHESGHYYWDKLIKNSACLNEFRSLFGDERQDYGNALIYYYDNGPAPEWQDSYISAYASMHPWEDWAETWAHYLHIVDTLETATEYEVSAMQSTLQNPLSRVNESSLCEDFTAIYEDWCRLTTVLNALNRSMGLDDAYPFVIPLKAQHKLQFIHNLVHGYCAYRNG
ncbi:hypothetical protein DXV75_07665 [Alteromonas aestuariivivens]|uniref:Zinc-ribbon domain-containing protein n=1 Tax=Alteromonas aestuariivivens TaxID=1938339 RepID=A0A3D8M7Z4_9ALTE|nr:putative zinc-binding metallopeptidase [Alteromonas aestuariivivens]RDV25957.1 hypothetical protein DXV75_07665 [Alteromonas aestuariivivens]